MTSDNRIVWCGSFSSMEQWVAKGKSWFAQHPEDRFSGRQRKAKRTSLVCMDAKGRVVTCGGDFQRAKDDGAYPVRFGWLPKDVPERYRTSAQGTSWAHVERFEVPPGDPDFGALYAAEKWLSERGYSVGPGCVTGPRGILHGDWAIAKWRHLTLTERAQLHGELHFERDGAATVLLRHEPRCAPPPGVVAEEPVPGPAIHVRLPYDAIGDDGSAWWSL